MDIGDIGLMIIMRCFYEHIFGHINGSDAMCGTVSHILTNRDKREGFLCVLSTRRSVSSLFLVYSSCDCLAFAFPAQLVPECQPTIASKTSLATAQTAAGCQQNTTSHKQKKTPHCSQQCQVWNSG